MGRVKQRSQALYRLYRSRSFDDVVGQRHVTDTLEAAVKHGSVSHAYLFTGPRGVGKTSVARILAHAINDLPYDGSTNHLDIIEIDAASNRGIDEIRDLREKVHLSPTSARYKVYIIDEVHMLTAQAFNALLKTLEEPPAHVVFMLATTETHKLPDTIVSRTQRFAFRPLSDSDVVDHLKEIASKEGIEADDAALNLIARHGSGSMRDSISLFDQVSSAAGRVVASEVEDLLGLAPGDMIEGLLKSLLQPDAEQLGAQLEQLALGGYDAVEVARQLTGQLRRQLTTGASVALVEDLLEVAPAFDPQLKLEAVLLRHAFDRGSSKAQASVPIAAESIAAPAVRAASSSVATPHEQWPRVLKLIKAKNNALYAVLRMAEVAVTPEGGALTLGFSFPFHQQRVKEPRNLAMLSEAAAEVFGRELTIRAMLSETKSPEASGSPGGSDPLSSVIRMMGGGSRVELEDD